jgi:AcrR family transcriptional regulator
LAADPAADRGLGMTNTSAVRALRADARRNQAQLLSAARDVFVERGSGVSLDEIARRAGVGIATLYRRFPDRTALLRAVVIDALEQTRLIAESALADEADAFDALVRYLHAALDVRVSAVVPLVLDKLDLDDAELRAAREASAQAVSWIVDAAHSAGALPDDITFADVGMVLVRLSRPLPGGISPELNGQLSHRHLDLFIEGLRPRERTRTLSGPALSRDDLHALRAAYQPKPDR